MSEPEPETASDESEAAQAERLAKLEAAKPKEAWGVENKLRSFIEFGEPSLQSWLPE